MILECHFIPTCFFFPLVFWLFSNVFGLFGWSFFKKKVNIILFFQNSNSLIHYINLFFKIYFYWAVFPVRCLGLVFCAFPGWKQMLISSAECSSEVLVRKKQELCESSNVAKVWINLFATSVQFPTQRISPCFSSYLLLWTPGAGRFCLKAIGINYNRLIPTFYLPTLFHKVL